MARIFIFDRSYDTIQTLRYALECHGQGHQVFANVVLKPGDKNPKLITNPVDVIGLLVHLRPFPDLVIAETGEVNGGWLCGLIHDMEMSRNCSFVLTGHQRTDQVRHLEKLYQVPFWPKPFNVNGFVERLETLLTVSC